MSSKTPYRAMALAAVAGSLAASAAYARYSFADYDMSKRQTQAGTIKEFRWGAPHSSLVLTHTKGGKSADMSITRGSPLMFTLAGFAPGDFKRGDKGTVGLRPNVNGSPGGARASMTLPDRRTYSDGEASTAAQGQG